MHQPLGYKYISLLGGITHTAHSTPLICNICLTQHRLGSELISNHAIKMSCLSISYLSFETIDDKSDFNSQIFSIILLPKTLLHYVGHKWALSRQILILSYANLKHTDQLTHPCSLIRVFAVHMKKAWVLSYPLSAQRRRWSDWADAQADLSLRWEHTHFVGFVMRWLIYRLFYVCFIHSQDRIITIDATTKISRLWLAALV